MTLPAPARPRIESVDLLRGFVMVIMALDHTRDYFGRPGISPTNLAQATVALFSTRWITNICAPVFFLLTAALGKLLPLGLILHAPGFLWQSPDHAIFVVYPLIPWVGVTALGFSLGRVFSWGAARRQMIFLCLGLAMCAAFVALRSINHYGDPLPWSHQRSVLYTVLSFLDTNKYPPSLLFLLMTLGPAMLLLPAFERWPSAALRPLLTFGRVPLFYYFLHAVLIHLLAVAVCYAHYGHVYWMFQSPTPANYPVTPPPGWGFGLPTVYLLWALVVTVSYPVCRWFARLKQRRRDPWLSYL